MKPAATHKPRDQKPTKTLYRDKDARVNHVYINIYIYIYIYIYIIYTYAHVDVYVTVRIRSCESKTEKPQTDITARDNSLGTRSFFFHTKHWGKFTGSRFWKTAGLGPNFHVTLASVCYMSRDKQPLQSIRCLPYFRVGRKSLFWAGKTSQIKLQDGSHTTHPSLEAGAEIHNEICQEFCSDCLPGKKFKNSMRK